MVGYLVDIRRVSSPPEARALRRGCTEGGAHLSPDLLSVEAVRVQLREGLTQRHPAGRGVQRRVQRLRRPRERAQHKAAAGLAQPPTIRACAAPRATAAAAGASASSVSGAASSSWSASRRWRDARGAQRQPPRPRRAPAAMQRADAGMDARALRTRTHASRTRHAPAPAPARRLPAGLPPCRLPGWRRRGAAEATKAPSRGALGCGATRCCRRRQRAWSARSF